VEVSQFAEGGEKIKPESLTCWHGPCLPLCNFLVFWMLGSGTVVPPQAHAMPSLLVTRSILFIFVFLIIYGEIPTKQLKITQRKIKVIKLVGCLPPSARLKLLA